MKSMTKTNEKKKNRKKANTLQTHKWEKARHQFYSQYFIISHAANKVLQWTFDNRSID